MKIFFFVFGLPSDDFFFSTLKKTVLGETGCSLINTYFQLTSQASSFLIHPLFWTQSVRPPWYPNPHCAVLLWLGVTPLLTKYCPPNPNLGKLGISLGVWSILKMCLCLHTYLTSHQKVLGNNILTSCWFWKHFIIA